MQQGTAAVTTSREGCAAVIQINEPPVNALSQAVRQGLIDAARHLGAEPSAEAIVITGVRQRLIAGADSREMGLPPGEPFLPAVFAALEAVGKPLMAAISGPALGGELEIALACDLRLAPRGAAGTATHQARRGLILRSKPSLTTNAKSTACRDGTLLPMRSSGEFYAVMVNEGARILAEAISLRPSDIDLVVVHGYGFLRLRGGPMFATDQRVLAAVLEDAKAAGKAGRAGSEPAPLLVDLARAKRTFAN